MSIKKVEHDFLTRLFQFLGRSEIIIHQVDISLKSLNHRDSFVLDTGKKLLVWHGRDSHYRKRNKALFFSKGFNEEQGNMLEIIEIEEDNSKDTKAFLDFIGDIGEISSIYLTPEAEDEEFQLKNSRTLYKISEISGRMEIGVWNLPQLLKEVLDSSSCFVLDCHSMIFIWAGTYSSNSERNWAMLKAEQLLVRDSRPNCASITWIIDGDERILFREQFSDWRDNSWDIKDKKEEKKEKKKEKLRVKDSLSKQDVSPEEIQILKELHKEGYLEKKHGNEWKKRYFVLKEGILYRYTDRNGKILKLFPLDECTLHSYTNENSFQLIASTKKSIILRAENEFEMHLWMNAIIKNKLYIDDPKVFHERALTISHQHPLEIPKKRRESDVNRTVSPTKVKPETKAVVDLSIPPSRPVPQLPNNFVAHPHIKPAPKLPTTPKPIETKKEAPPPPRSAKPQLSEAKQLVEKEDKESSNTLLKDDTSTLIEKKQSKEEILIESNIQKEEKIILSKEGKQTNIIQDKKKEFNLEDQKIKDVKQFEPPNKEEKIKENIKEENPIISREKKLIVQEETSNATPPLKQGVINEDERSKENLILKEEKKQSMELKEEQSSIALSKLSCSKCGTFATNDKAKFCNFCGSELIERTLLSSSRKPAITGRKAPKKNAVRERNLVSEQNKAPEVSTGTTKKAPVGFQVGGFGLLYSLGDELGNLFKKSEKNQKKTPSSEDDHAPRLIQIKGRKRIFVRRVELSISSLNEGDVFLLDTGKKGSVIYQWNGPQSNRIEKGKAMDVAKSIKDKERAGLHKVVVLESGVDDEEFWTLLTGSHSKSKGKYKISSAEEGGDDSLAEKALWERVKLFKVCLEDTSGPLAHPELIEIGCNRLYKEELLSNECYILDSVTEVYCWTGKKAPLKTKNAGMQLAQKILDLRTDFWTTPLRREFEDAESVLFKEKFCNWSTLPIQMQQVPIGLNTAPRRDQIVINILDLHKKPIPKEELLIDSGNGKLTVWRVSDFKKFPIDPSQYGHFYSGESYVILYTYIWKNKDCHLIYFWQGRTSSLIEKGSSALLTMELDDQLSRMAKEIRVMQNKEPKHFLLLFQGKFVIHLGKEQDPKPDQTLFQIQGHSQESIKAIQIPLNVQVLSTNSVFLLMNQTNSFIWKGKCATVAELEFAKNLALRLGSNHLIEIIEEGKEPSTFWNSLIGEKSSYYWKALENRIIPRLFQCSIATGIFKVEEITNFFQDDLNTDDCFLLDGFHEIYVWIGNNSDEKEKKLTMEIAIEYIEKTPDGRTKENCPIYVILEKEEPPSFTSLFHGWDFTKYGGQPPTSTPKMLAQDILSDYNRTYTYEELVNKEFSGLDTGKLETYLSKEEFEEVFGVTLQTFQTFPIWKQQKIKREFGLF